MSNIKQSLLSKLDNNEKCVTMRLDYGWRTEENLTRFIILSVCVFFLFLFLFLNRRRCLTTRLVFPSNIETISQPGSERPTTMFNSRTSLLSSNILGSPQTIQVCLLFHFIVVQTFQVEKVEKNSIGLVIFFTFFFFFFLVVVVELVLFSICFIALLSSQVGGEGWEKDDNGGGGMINEKGKAENTYLGNDRARPQYQWKGREGKVLFNFFRANLDAMTHPPQCPFKVELCGAQRW